MLSIHRWRVLSAGISILPLKASRLRTMLIVCVLWVCKTKREFPTGS
jgi:hypothetical protein